MNQDAWRVEMSLFFINVCILFSLLLFTLSPLNRFSENIFLPSSAQVFFKREFVNQRERHQVVNKKTIYLLQYHPIGL